MFCSLFTYFDSKDLDQKTISDKVQKYWPFEVAKNPKYDGYQRGLASNVYRFFDEKTRSAVSVNKESV